MRLEGVVAGSPCAPRSWLSFTASQRVPCWRQPTAGQSTALKTLFGLLRPSVGDVLVDVTAVGKSPREMLALDVAFVPRDATCLLPSRRCTASSSAPSAWPGSSSPAHRGGAAACSAFARLHGQASTVGRQSSSKGSLCAWSASTADRRAVDGLSPRSRAAYSSCFGPWPARPSSCRGTCARRWPRIALVLALGGSRRNRRPRTCCANDLNNISCRPQTEESAGAKTPLAASALARAGPRRSRQIAVVSSRAGVPPAPSRTGSNRDP